jgi:putative chitinase
MDADLGLTAVKIAKATGSNLDAAAQFLPLFNDAFPRYDITTTPRIAMFLAQAGHESGGLKWLEEIWGPTETQLHYEGRSDLGNTQPGDGWKYRGRGIFQITGRANYQREGLMLDQDFVSSPDLVSMPYWATETACMIWLKHGCNQLADDNGLEAITRIINGRLTGYADRLALYNDAMDVLSEA